MSQASRQRPPILVLETRSPWLGSGLDLTLRQPGLPWESETRSLLFREVLGLLRSVPGWQLEYQQALDPERLALFPKLERPTDSTERAAVAGALASAIERITPQGRTLALVDWTLRPWLLDHPGSISITAPMPDQARHEQLRALRTPLLAPWLAGTRPVLDQVVFEEFHLQLNAAERSLFEQLRPSWEHGLVPDELVDWQRDAAKSLATRGFAKVVKRNFGLGHTETRVVRDTKGAHLASWERLAL